MPVKRLIKFTAVFLLYNKTLGWPSHKILGFLFFNTDVEVSQIKIESWKHDTKTGDILLSLRT